MPPAQAYLCPNLVDAQVSVAILIAPSRQEVGLGLGQGVAPGGGRPQEPQEAQKVPNHVYTQLQPPPR